MTAILLKPVCFDDFQDRVRNWLESTFGKDASAQVHTRACRLLEEAAEAVQAIGMQEEKAQAIVRYVFSRPVGQIDQEIAGVAVTLAALANAVDVQLSTVTTQEMIRIESPEIREKARRRDKEKRQSGIE